MKNSISLNLSVFKTCYPETRAKTNIEQDILNSMLYELYQENAVYLDTSKTLDTKNTRESMKAQLDILRDKFSEINFEEICTDIIKKADFDASTLNSKTLTNDLKKSTEILYCFIKQNNLDINEVKRRYKLKEYKCDPGTNTNFQMFLSELFLLSKSIDNYISEVKVGLIRSIAAELLNNANFCSNFCQYSSSLEQFEIHYITSLTNSISREYNLIEVSSVEDNFIKSVDKTPKMIFRNTIEQRITAEEGTKVFINLIATKIADDLSTTLSMDKYDMNNNESRKTFAREIQNRLDILNFGKFYIEGKEINIISPASIIQYDYNYKPVRYKLHFREIIENAVIFNMHQKGLINCNYINLIKLKLKVELSTDENGINAITKEVLSDEDLCSYKEEIIEYIARNLLILDKNDFSTYNIYMYIFSKKIEIKGIDHKVFIKQCIEKYIDETDPNVLQKLEKTYQEIHNSIAGHEVKLLGLDSILGTLVKKEWTHKILTAKCGPLKDIKIDFTKCSLPLIKECYTILEKNKKMQPKNFHKMSKIEKVIYAIEYILYPIICLIEKVQSKIVEIYLRDELKLITSNNSVEGNKDKNFHWEAFSWTEYVNSKNTKPEIQRCIFNPTLLKAMS